MIEIKLDDIINQSYNFEDELFIPETVNLAQFTQSTASPLLPPIKPSSQGNLLEKTPMSRPTSYENKQ